MKTKSINSFAFITILILLLEACSSTLTQPPTEIATSTFTPTPTTTPTITPSPTETPDPNRPADATGQDENGYYYKEVQENGKNIRHYWIEIKDINYTNSNIKGWFVSHVLEGSLNGGIPLIDQEADGYKKTIPLYFEVQDGLQLPYLRHPDNPYSSQSPNFTRIFWGELESRYFGIPFSKVPREDRIKFGVDLVYNSKITIPFTTSAGNYVWKLTQNIGYKFYAIKWDDADPALHPQFLESKCRLGREDFIFRWTVFTDADGFLVGISAVNEPENLSDEGFLGWIIYPMATVIVSNQFSSGCSIAYGLVKYGFASGSVGFKTEGGTPVVGNVSPHFEIIQNP